MLTMDTLREKLPNAGNVMQTLGLGNGGARTSYTSTIALLALGATAGAALALLLSGRSSERLREEVREQAAAWRERVAPSAPPRTDWTESAA